MKWTNKDKKQADKEGWNLFQAGVGLQLEKIDANPETMELVKFEDDTDAWDFVVIGALNEDNKLHRKALAILALENPLELQAIMQKR